MDHVPPPPPPIRHEMDFSSCSYKQCYRSADDMIKIHDKYKELIHPLNKAIYDILVELRKYPDDENLFRLIEKLNDVREETVTFLGLAQADRGLVSKGPWPPGKSVVK